MSDFARLAEAFSTLARSQEAAVSAKSAVVNARRSDLAELRRFLDRPEMMSGPGYSEGLLRIVRSEAEVQRLEKELSALRLEHSRTERKRDKCLARARQDAAMLERQRGEHEILELVSGAETSLAQPRND